MNNTTPSEQIDMIINQYGGWKGDTLSQIRTAINGASSEITEEIKWRMRTRPEGLPVWEHNGIICFAETWKDNIKLIFQKGALLSDPSGVFNARLESPTLRAIEI